MILFLMMSGPPEGALMRRHVGGIGCGARGRERTLLPHPGGAGAPPGGQYEPPARSMATRGRHRPAHDFARCAKPARGTTDGSRKARPGAVRKTPAMARHEAPAFSRGSAASNEQWLRHLARHLPLFFGGTRETTAYPAPEKNTGDDARPVSERRCLTIEYVLHAPIIARP